MLLFVDAFICLRSYLLMLLFVDAVICLRSYLLMPVFVGALIPAKHKYELGSQY